jgi:DNA-binding MarR family transcriptional regulator
MGRRQRQQTSCSAENVKRMPVSRPRGRAATEDALDRALRACRLSPVECVLRHVTHTSRAVVAAFDETLKPSGLTGHQFNLLMSVARAGPLTVNTLAALIGVDPTTVPRAIVPLTRDRLVTVGIGKDRRERVIAITPRGRGRLAAALPNWEVLQQSIVRALGQSTWTSSMAMLRQIRHATAPSDKRQSAAQ